MLNNLEQIDFNMNYFQFFELPIMYTISLQQLETAYLNKQRAYHPDYYPNQLEKMKATQISAWINDSYNTLKSPILRAKYLLKLHHILVDMATMTIRDTDFLMKQMSLKEALAAYQSSTMTDESIDQLFKETEQCFADSMIAFAACFETQPMQLQEAVEWLKKMFFLSKWSASFHQKKEINLRS
ncbi:MAG: Fe-S protein assembly co-chaperone HscB [Endozoicomonadaceae bacterium]|nr:Fe-S protein assembly co-chaperone HscB [Endozoicomonadaceae bacterium]